MTLPVSQPQIRIRPMGLPDVEQVHLIDQLSFTLPWPENAYRYEIRENPYSLLWVAEMEAPSDPSQVIGMIVVWLILDEAHIATIAVHPNYRQHGIATRLLLTALQEALQRGSRMATLEVRAHNLAAQKLYQRFGFEIVGRRPRYYRDNHEDALIMTLSHLDPQRLSQLEEAAGSGNYAPPQAGQSS